MADEGFKRKLTAILSADAIGYSRLMRDDEEATVRDIATHRVLISDIVQQHHGRVVDSPGDNILAEFASVVDAVNGAIKIQGEIKRSNTETPEDRRMEFRIGINLGDVIEEEERIYGDGVNIAARVERLASAGGIAISGTVYEHIKDKLSLGYHYLGEQDVKNIPEPVRVYRLLTEPNEAGKMIGEEKPKSRKSRYIAFGALGLIILVVGALVIWNNYFRAKIEAASVEKMAHPLPDRPSIAVLAFDNLSGDPEQEYFSDGLSEEIITSLSKSAQIFVIARNSSFTYKGKPVKVQQVSEELGVRYVLEGSVRKDTNRVRITAQLIDAVNGTHLWAERYDRELNDIFALQDEITMKIITALQVEITEGEQMRMWAKNRSLDLQLKTMELMSLWRKGTRESHMRHGQLAQEIIDMAPENAIGYSSLGFYYWYLAMSGKSPRESIAKAFKLAQKALSLDESNPTSYALLSNLYVMMRQYDKAIAAGERGVVFNPNGALNHCALGITLSFAGKVDEAIDQFKQAIRLDPFPEYYFFTHLGRCYRMKGQYEEALSEFKKALHVSPDAMLNNIQLAAIYALLDRQDEAGAAVKKVLEINPSYSAEKVKAYPYKNQADLKLLIDALRKAGFPEGT